MARTVAGITGALEQVIFSEELARRPGLLQVRDSRVKVALGILLLVAVGLAHHLAVVVGVYLFASILAAASRLSLWDFSKRIWLGVPLFAGVVALPSLFLIPGEPVLRLMDSPPWWLAVTDNGAASAVRFVARVGASVSLVLLLVSTTRWSDLLRALRVLRVPQSFLVVLSMTYRYLFLLLHAANSLFLARASRTVGMTSGAEQRRWAAGVTGALMGRSLKLSGDVLLAMQGRGFRGEIRGRAGAEMGDEDWLMLSMGVVAAVAIILIDRGLS